jgi:hypothetical protein
MPMILGDYTLTYYPSGFTPPRPARSNAYLETMESVAHFSWGVSIVGKIIELDWNYMPSEQFDSLDAIFQEDEEVVWDPGIPGLSDTYNVEILDFTGEFHEAVGSDTEIWRKNCKMMLLIMSEVI